MLSKTTAYFKESEIFRRLLKNAGKLISGDIIASILNLVSVALSARVLGPSNFGILALIQTYITIVDQLFNFQSWQALIKYGSDALVNNNLVSFKRLLKFGFKLDVTTAFLGTVAAILGAFFILPFFDWSEDVTDLVILYSLVILFNINGTPTAILRLYDRFDLFAYQKIVVAVVKLLSVAIAFFYNAGLYEFLLIWIISDFLGYVILIAFSFYELKRQSLTGFFKSNAKLVTLDIKDIWTYVWTTNLHGSVRMVSMQFDTIIVGALLGNIAVGYLKVAKQFAQILSKLSQPIYKSVYPELAKIWAGHNRIEFKKLILSTCIVSGSLGLVVWIIFLIAGGHIINISVGPEFIAANRLVQVYMLAVVISMLTLPLTPAMLAMGLPKVSFNAILISTLVYFPFLYLFVVKLGIVGIGYAYILFYCIWMLIMFVILKNKFGDGKNSIVS